MAFSPLDNQLELVTGNYSPELQRDLVWLSGHVPYAVVSETLERLGAVAVPPASVWRICQVHGQRLATQAAWFQNQVGLDRLRWSQAEYEPQARKGVSMDGGMVLVREEGWKELKVGVVSDLVAPDIRQFDASKDPLHRNLHYTASLGGVPEFSAALWCLAVQHNVPYAGQVAVTADGAAWIWGLTAELFPGSTQVVDWFHAAQHIDAAALKRFPADNQSDEAKRWSEALKQFLFHGECFKVIAALHQANLSDDAAYFETHQHRMDYPAFRADGFPIGSGSTESAVKQFKHRLCGPGMRWSRTGLNQMVVIRAAVLDSSFDALWDAA